MNQSDLITCCLRNGTRIVVSPMQERSSVSLGIYTHSGSRHEAMRFNGISHFTEHMVFKGTKRHSARQLSVQADRIGSAINAFTTEDHTCYHARCPSRSTARLTRLLGDMYKNPVFPEKEIVRERAVIEEEIQMYHEQPAAQAEELLATAAWPDHALGRPILGNSSTLKRCDQTTFHGYRERAHCGRRTVVVAVGDVNDKTVELLAENMGDLPAGRVAPFRGFQSNSRWSRRLISEHRDIEQFHLAFGFYCGGRTACDVQATRILSVLLGETMGSRLFYHLREKRGYGYMVYTNRELFEECGLFTIYAGIDAARVSEATSVILAELDKLREKGPSDRELREAVRWTIDQNTMAMEDTATAMFWLGECMLSPNTVIDDEAYCEELRRLRPDDIRRVAAEVFKTRRFSAALVGPNADSAMGSVGKQFAKFG